MPLAYIALGANLPSSAGSPNATLAAAVERLAALGRIAARSSLYSTAPVGLEDQPRFLNAVVALETHCSPRELLHSLLDIEQAFGRDRAASVPTARARSTSTSSSTAIWLSPHPASKSLTRALPSEPSFSCRSTKSRPISAIHAPEKPWRNCCWRSVTTWNRTLSRRSKEAPGLQNIVR